MHDSAATPRENYLSSLGKAVLPCLPWTHVPAGFNSSCSGKAKQQQFTSALLGFCSAAKLNSPAEPRHSSGICLQHRERAGNGFGASQISTSHAQLCQDWVPRCFYAPNASVKVRQ